MLRSINMLISVRRMGRVLRNVDRLGGHINRFGGLVDRFLLLLILVEQQDIDKFYQIAFLHCRSILVADQSSCRLRLGVW